MNLQPFEILTAFKNQLVTATANGYSLDSRDGAGVPKYETALVNWEVGDISGYVQSYIESNLTNATDNDMRFTATDAAGLGTAGDGITITYVDPGEETATETVTVVGRAITVTLRSVSLTLSTAAQVKTAIEASAAATALVTVTAKGSDTLTGVVAAMSAITTASGADRKAITLTVQESDVAANASANTTCATVGGGTASQVVVASTSYKMHIKRTKRYVRCVATVAETGEAVSGAFCAQMITIDNAELPLITASSVLNS